ncbi:hypothetical protein SNOG_10793 [Parastagonospora nodorum SN15]|uniref:Uncharacterized protein n=1 Tax=Phaeosphaeria nodorum (strain SN15 / ATCC MYA-4574 / FGSC 10173) TaxID=321614 RepID=Q0UBS1_PHANO|nr:hypothetical protein SNOG_10793 [Parastagonospora nodorum SN15]EAT82187.1 hypothetical protein SNOG_10793 [Parastagonospora nodorum SN15]
MSEVPRPPRSTGDGIPHRRQASGDGVLAQTRSLDEAPAKLRYVFLLVASVLRPSKPLELFSYDTPIIPIAADFICFPYLPQSRCATQIGPIRSVEKSDQNRQPEQLAGLQ